MGWWNIWGLPRKMSKIITYGSSSPAWMERVQSDFLDRCWYEFCLIGSYGIHGYFPPVFLFLTFASVCSWSHKTCGWAWSFAQIDTLTCSIYIYIDFLELLLPLTSIDCVLSCASSNILKFFLHSVWTWMSHSEISLVVLQKYVVLEVWWHSDYLSCTQTLSQPCFFRGNQKQS